MKYSLLMEVIELLEVFESEAAQQHITVDIEGFKNWMCKSMAHEMPVLEPDWEGKENGRSPESVINTLVVHMNRYAKTYSRAAIHDSAFSTQEEFIYLINLKAFGAMTKMELIKRNIQDKPTGMQIIGRLLKQGWIIQKDSETDRRSKIIAITDEGLMALEQQMDKIRMATKMVTGDLDYTEKMELIRLLTKLDHFHQPVFAEHIDSSRLLDWMEQKYIKNIN